jgi:hypothetical protein
VTSGIGTSRHFVALRNLVAIGACGFWQAVRPADLWVHGLGRYFTAAAAARRSTRESRSNASRAGKAQTRRNSHYAASHWFEQQSESERCQRLRDTRRGPNKAEPIGVVLGAENRERQCSARNRQNAVAGAVEQGERRGRSPAEHSDSGAALATVVGVLVEVPVVS